LRLKPAALDDRIPGMFESLQSADEAAMATLKQCYWSYGSYAVLGCFGAPVALFRKHGPTHLLAAACFFGMIVLALWFLYDAIEKGPPTQRKLNRRMTLMMWLTLAPGAVNLLIM
jgi:hypothetical protein